MSRSLLLVALLAAPVALSADLVPASVVSYREAGMKAMGSHMKMLGLIAKGEAPAADAKVHADALAAIAPTLGAMWPAGTGPEVKGLHTESKPEVWTQKDAFAAAVASFEAETKKLAEVAATGDLVALKAQQGKVGESCGACHDKFKVDDH